MFLHLAVDLESSVSHSDLFGYTHAFCLHNFALLCENELSHFSEEYSFTYP